MAVLGGFCPDLGAVVGGTLFGEEVAFMLTSTIHLGGTQNMFVVPVKATSAQEARAET